MNLDFQNLQLYQYFLIFGGAAALVAIVAYLFKGNALKVPAIVSCSVGFLFVGVGAGMGSLLALGYEKDATKNRVPRKDGAQASMPQMGGRGMGGGPPMGGFGGPGKGMGMGMGGPPGGGMGGMGGGMGGMGGGMGMGGGRRQQQNSKKSLADLVSMLNLMIANGNEIQLSADQKQKVATQLTGLQDLEDLSENLARDKLLAITAIIKDQQEAIEANGFTWPVSATQGGPARTNESGKAAPNTMKESPTKAPANPFREGAKKNQLEKLLRQLGNAGTPNSKAAPVK